MPTQLSLRARPKSLSEVVGQERTVAKIKRRLEEGRIHKAWLFHGPKGSGKTSMSRILAVSLQCEHQKEAGCPCKDCWKKYRDRRFSILEINTSDKTGVDAARSFMSASDYELVGEGKYRIYILNEAHQLSNSSQNLLLDYFEEAPKQNVFIICTTRPDKILDTLRSRCVELKTQELKLDGIRTLVERLLAMEGSELSPDDLADALQEKGVCSPRLVCNAVENYVMGESADDSALVEGSGNVNSIAVIRSVLKGEWADAAALLKKATDNDYMPLRRAVIAYLKTVLLESPDIGDREKAVAKCIQRLCYMPFSEEGVQLAALSAELSFVSSILGKHGF